MTNFYDKHKKSINQIIVFVVSLIAALLFLKFVFRLVAPFVLAFVLTLIISPSVDFIVGKLRVPRVAATIFSMAVVLSALVLLVSGAIRLLTGQMLAFATGFPETFDKAMKVLNSFQQSYDSFFEIIPEDMRGLLDGTVVSVVNSIALWAGDAARAISLSAVKGIPKTFIFTLITIISTLFMTKDKHKLSSFIMRQMPESATSTTTIVKKDIFGALWGYIKAQMILMCFSGFIAITGLTVLGYEYSLLIGVLIAFLDALPVFGPSIILWPWAAVCVLASEYRFAVGLLIIYLCITFCRQMVEPKILSAQIGLYPLVTLVSLYAGLMVLGPAGLIAGPLLAIIIRSLQNADLLPNWK